MFDAKKVFKYYKPGKEYWVNIDRIHISEDFEKHHPRSEKLTAKWRYYLVTGKFESKIVLNRNFELVDGFTSFLIAKRMDLGKVPVWFGD